MIRFREFIERAHCDEKHDPSAPRIGGSVLLVLIVFCVFGAIIGAIIGNKELAKTAIDLVAKLCAGAAAIYGASQLKSGIVGLRSSPSPVPSPPTQLEIPIETPQEAQATEPAPSSCYDAQKVQRLREALAQAREAISQATQGAPEQKKPTFLLQKRGGGS